MRPSLWNDDYWLPLLQLYLRKPAGMKPMYGRELVALSLELHIAPADLHARMAQIDQIDSPRLARIRNLYEQNPRQLTRAVKRWREQRGYGAGDAFYEGVELQETFETDFRPISADSRFTPVALILVLNLYFQLTPLTMVAETPEVTQLARLLKVTPAQVVEVMDIFQLCDPYLGRSDVSLSPLLPACSQVWQRYGDMDLTRLNQLAEQLADFYK